MGDFAMFDWRGRLFQSVQETRAQLTIAGLWIALVSGLQAMLVEDFEFYAVYESSYSDLAFSFLTFKPVEYLCEVVAVFAVLQGRALANDGLIWIKRRFNLAIAA